MIECANSLADPLALLSAGTRAVAGDLACPGRENRAKRLVSICSRVAGARPLKAPDLFALGRRPARQAAPPQTAPDGRVAHAELRGDQPRPPARALSRFADAVMDLRVPAPADGSACSAGCCQQEPKSAPVSGNE